MVFKPGWKDKKKAEEKKVVEPPPEAPKEPIYKSFHIEKVKGNWNLVVCEIQGDKILSKTYKEAENKAMSLETFKIAFAKLYYFGK